MTIKSISEIKRLEDDSTVCYSEIQRGENLLFSKSGKAVLFNRPRHTGTFWIPASLVRISSDWQSRQYGAAVLVPTWFLIQERIEF